MYLNLTELVRVFYLLALAGEGAPFKNRGLVRTEGPTPKSIATWLSLFTTSSLARTAPVAKDKAVDRS